ncbi:hypothetical protein ABT354_03020 [Streptomyces sp. NPDC000594]|uniref:COG4315 family predicted lipoprotein n=1 Tax=Streptomyces sp. NPDC000594 TaxID=3154261 RepID=UPI00331BE1B6
MPRNRAAPLLTAAAATFSLLALGACADSSGDPPAASSPASSASPAPRPAASVRVADSVLGRILVDGAGRTLYASTTRCSADCVTRWPALTSTGPLTAGPGTRPALLTRTEHTPGTEQAVYGDRPLYYYVGDTLPGDTNGQGLDGEWFALAPDATLIRTPA